MAFFTAESVETSNLTCLNMIAERNNQLFQLCSDGIVEAGDFYSQNSVSDIIAAHLKMLPLSLGK
jgi:hypothetical protein